jgi:UDP-N-acetylglucosamine acyltransferase
MTIHKTAVISSEVELGEGVEVGPYAIIEGKVKVGAGSKLYPHSYVGGNTTLGKNCQIFPFASVGMTPQDLKYEGEDSRTTIGDNTVIRESATIHRGTAGGGMETRLGANCFIMACAHVGHDCILGNNVILANAVLLAGHCELEDYAFLGGNVLAQQFIKVGAHTFIGGSSGLAGHVPPYISTFHTPAVWTGINIVGLSRRGFEKKAIQEIRKFYNQFFKIEGTPQARIEKLEKEFSSKEVMVAIDFIKNCFGSKHAILQARRR